MKFNDEQGNKLQKLINLMKKRAIKKSKEKEDRFYVGLIYAYENLEDMFKAISYSQEHPELRDCGDTDWLLNKQIQHAIGDE